MARDLKSLIDAGASAPWAAGESFLDHVNESDAGDGFTDYFLTAWELSNIPSDPGDYAHGTQFVIGISFTQASHAQYIKRTGNVVTIQRTSFPTDGTDVQKDTSSVLAGDTGSSVTVTLIGGRVHTGNIVASVWFQGYSEPNVPPGSGSEPIVFNATLNNPNGGGSPRELNFNARYVVDAGDFNPELVQLIETNVLTQPELLSHFEFEWHGNDTYTDLIATSSAYITSTTPGQTKELWMRHRPFNNPSYPNWTNYGYISFFDPR